MGTWNKDRATKRIDAKIDALPLKDIEIKEYVRETDLSGLSTASTASMSMPTFSTCVIC